LKVGTTVLLLLPLPYDHYHHYSTTTVLLLPRQAVPSNTCRWWQPQRTWAAYLYVPTPDIKSAAQNFALGSRYRPSRG